MDDLQCGTVNKLCHQNVIWYDTNTISGCRYFSSLVTNSEVQSLFLIQETLYLWLTLNIIYNIRVGLEAVTQKKEKLWWLWTQELCFINLWTLEVYINLIITDADLLQISAVFLKSICKKMYFCQIWFMILKT